MGLPRGTGEDGLIERRAHREQRLGPRSIAKSLPGYTVEIHPLER